MQENIIISKSYVVRLTVEQHKEALKSYIYDVLGVDIETILNINSDYIKNLTNIEVVFK